MGKVARFPHYLRENKRATMPQRMIFMDTETYIQRISDTETEYPFRLGVAHYWRRRRDGTRDRHEWFAFIDPTQFWDWVEQHLHKKTLTYLIAHHLLFDLAALDWRSELTRRGFEKVFEFDNNRTSLYKYRKDSKTLYCVNNANIFSGRLEDWANEIGLPKIEVDFDDVDDAKLFKHCHRDVEIMVELWRWWLSFLEEHNLGMFRPTIASQAMGAYRHRFMRVPIHIHNYRRILALERAAYRGARVQPFRVGKFSDGPYYKLDVNSMYPYVYVKYQYPSKFLWASYRPTLAELADLLEKHGVIAEVTVNVDEPWFPVSRNGINVYPIGTFDTVLTTEELSLALERGWIEGVRFYAVYQMDDLFSDFVEALYPLKEQYSKNNHRLRRRLIKDMLNLLHGKFGQRGYVEEEIGKCDPNETRVEHCINAQTSETYTMRRENGTITRVITKGESFNSFPAIPAHVAANARIELYRLVKEAGDGNVYYCDTDCLIVDRWGIGALHRLIDNSALGYLKMEEVADEVEIHAPKDYTFGGKKVVKGVPPRATWLDENTAEVETWPGLHTYLANAAAHGYRTKRVIKALARQVNHGWVDEDGWVRPFVYPKDEEER